jgi:serine/threonine protein kinase
MGLARLEDALTSDGAGAPGLTESGNIMGTIDFMAPEQALDAKAADRRADIYSLGCTLHYLLTAHTLYAGDTVMKRIMAHRFEPVPALRAARPEVPEWLDVIFQKMIAKDVANRYQSMTEVLTALAPFVASGLSSPETNVSMLGRWSFPDDPAPLRPAAALLVKVPGTEASPLAAALNQTASSTGFDTLCQAIAAERRVPAAPGSDGHRGGTCAEGRSLAFRRFSLSFGVPW